MRTAPGHPVSDADTDAMFRRDECVVRYGIMMHTRPGGEEWLVRMDDRLFDTHEEACEDDRDHPRFSEFEREIDDAFTAVVEVVSVV